jgi:hypothetical protein
MWMCVGQEACVDLGNLFLRTRVQLPHKLLIW